MNLSDELRNQLLEAAAWGKAGINITETREVQAEEQETLEEGKTRASRKERPVIEEEEAVHVCPLCISQLDEAIEEDALLEHLDVVMGLVDRLSQINEGDEDVDAVIEEALTDLLLGDYDEEALDEEELEEEGRTRGSSQRRRAGRTKEDTRDLPHDEMTSSQRARAEDHEGAQGVKTERGGKGVHSRYRGPGRRGGMTTG